MEFIKELRIKMGLRPYLSESLPKIAEKRNWNREKRAITTPTRKTLPPTLSIRRGRIGITIPNPSKSIKTTRSKINNFLSDIKNYCTNMPIRNSMISGG